MLVNIIIKSITTIAPIITAIIFCFLNLTEQGPSREAGVTFLAEVELVLIREKCPLKLI